MTWQGGMTHGEWHKTRAFKTPCLLHHCIWSIVLRFLTQLNFQFLILCKGSFYGQNGHCSFILFSIDRNLSEFPYFYRTQVRSLPFLSVSQTITESLSLLRFDWWPTPRFIISTFLKHLFIWHLSKFNLTEQNQCEVWPTFWSSLIKF